MFIPHNEFNQIKKREKDALTNETNTVCVSLKITNYNPAIKTLSTRKQQQKLHQNIIIIINIYNLIYNT